MSVRVGINGFGRIGRNMFRAGQARADASEIEWVAVNDLTDARTLAHLLAYDSILGPLPGRGPGARRARDRGRRARADGARRARPRRAAVGRARRRRRDRVDRSVHQPRSGRRAPRPGRKEGDHLGARDRPRRRRSCSASTSTRLTTPSRHHVISNASCTTNCLAPVAKVINDTVGIAHGLMTTIHAYTADQRLQDLPHKDLRRARAAAINLIPTSTGAAKAIGLVIPELQGKLHGFADPRPGADRLGRRPDRRVRPRDDRRGDQRRAAGRLAVRFARGPAGLHEPTRSSRPTSSNRPTRRSSTRCSPSVIDRTMVKVIAWYDNEWGYSNRLVDLVERVL